MGRNKKKVVSGGTREMRAMAREEYGLGEREEYGLGEREEYGLGEREEYGLGEREEYGLGEREEYGLGASEHGKEKEKEKDKEKDKKNGFDTKELGDVVDVIGEVAEVMVGGKSLNKGDNLYGMVDYSSINIDNKFLPIEFIEKQEYNYYTTSFYSLAKLIQFIFNIKIENIYYTKLYYFLDRCLENIPEDRIFLYL